MAFEKEEELAVGLFNRDAIKYAGSDNAFWTLKSGRKSPVYVNLRGITSFSGSLSSPIHEQKRTRDLAVEAYSSMLDDSAYVYDHILGIPHALTALSGLVAKSRGESLISMRSEEKSYGAHKAIEGDYDKNDIVVALDDVVTDGASKFEVIEAIRAERLRLFETAVLIDRQEGGRENLEKADIILISAFGLGRVTSILRSNSMINARQFDWMEEYYQRLVDDGVINEVPQSLFE